MSGIEDDQRFARGLRDFNAGRFFEAHEVWEDLWSEEVGEEKRFLQGLIQAAAGYHKAEIGVSAGAHKLFGKCLAILESFPPEAFGVDLEALRRRVRGDLAGIPTQGQPRLERAGS